MELKDGIKTFYAKNGKAWRRWLEKNHVAEKSVWLIIYKKQSKMPSVYYDEAVDEALCFGWIDSKPNKRDDESYYQFFSKRNAKSNWSKVNKAKVDKLLAEGRIAEPGLAAISLAKQNGTWIALDEIEEMIIPPDIDTAFNANPIARSNFEAFPKSVKKGILEWIINAKQPETKQKRINETVNLAAENIRANQFRSKDSL